MNTVNVEAYFTRIGLDVGLAAGGATLELLNRIVEAHVRTIPFENLDVLLGRPIELTPEALQAKLIDSRRGGYCFEQNGLLLLVLEALGFEVTGVSARVRYQRARHEIPPRTHLFVRVELGGESYLADVGVGSMSLTCALKLNTGDEQPTPHESRRILREGGVLFHQVKLGEQWHDVSEFTLEAMPPIDRTLANYYTSTHPSSHFKSRLSVARSAPNGERRTVLNRDFTVRSKDGSATVRRLRDPADLLEVLQREFGLVFAPGTEFICPGLDWSTA